MSYGEAVQNRAPLMTLVNIRTNETFEVQFNPTQLEEVVGVNYARQTVPGLSHQVMQFVHTENEKFSFELFFEATRGASSVAQQARIMDARRFLLSLTHPRRLGGLVGGGAPRALFVWPSFISLSCVVTNLKFSYNRFNLAGAPCQFLATVSLEEIRDVHVTSDVMRAQGTLRGGSRKEGT